MLLGVLVMATALVISAVAIYYSVAGLVAIFAGAAIPIMIMGGALEIGKLVTAVWLHRYWSQAKWWLKTYLSIAVVVLMLITSLGVFGFLSKAHIEQTSVVKENLAQIEQIDSEILRQQQLIQNAEIRIQQIQSQNNTQDKRIQEQIDIEQQRIDTAYARVQPDIDRQQTIIDQELEKINQRTVALEQELEQLTSGIRDLETALAANDVSTAQSIVGTEVDGSLGPATRSAIEQYRITAQSRITELQSQISQIRSEPNTIIDSARAETERLRSRAEKVVDDSNALISRLRAQLGTVDRSEIDSAVADQRVQIEQASESIQTFTEQKFDLESQYRSLEAEVGPIKYIAEFIYAEQTDAELLEKAVRWVIVIIIFVFDPLAVLLLIASQYTFQMHHERKKNMIKEQISLENKNNENKTVDDTVHVKDDEQNRASIFEEQSQEDSDLDSVKTSVAEQNTNISEPESTEQIQPEQQIDDVVKSYLKNQEANHQENINETEKHPKNDDSYDDIDEKSERIREYNIRESSPTADTDKAAWKKDHPSETLKHYKTLFLRGEIDKLPWENYSVDTTDSGYRQNSEQSEKSLFKRLREND